MGFPDVECNGDWEACVLITFSPGEGVNSSLLKVERKSFPCLKSSDGVRFVPFHAVGTSRTRRGRKGRIRPETLDHPSDPKVCADRFTTCLETSS